MFTLIRVAAALAVLVLRCSAPRAYPSLFLAVLFGHYALSLWYSRRRVDQLLSARTPPLSLALLALGAALLPMAGGAALVVYFGLHHALTESYMVATRRGGPAALAPEERRLLASRVALTLSGYGLLLRHQAPFARVAPEILIALLLASALAFIVCLRGAARLPRSAAADVAAFEAVGVALALTGLWLPVTFRDAIFYHLIVWMMVPLRQLASTAARLTFLAQTAVISALLFTLMPYLGWFRHLTLSFWIGQSEFWGYFHITTSFALSGFNPRWISRWFAQRPLAQVGQAPGAP